MILIHFALIIFKISKNKLEQSFEKTKNSFKKIKKYLKKEKKREKNSKKIIKSFSSLLRLLLFKKVAFSKSKLFKKDIKFWFL